MAKRGHKKPKVVMVVITERMTFAVTKKILAMMALIRSHRYS